MEILSAAVKWLALALFSVVGLYGIWRILRQMALVAPPRLLAAAEEKAVVLPALSAPPHPLRSLLLLAVVSRVLMFLFMAVAGGTFLSLSGFFDPWIRWDAHHYLWLAGHGYAQTGDIHKDVLLVFYPLYPLLIKLVSLPLGGHVGAAAFLLSNGCMLGASAVLYKLFCRDFDTGIAYRAVKYFLLSPFAFFLSIPFTESLFILLSAGCFYAARRRCWPVAGLVGMLCTLCRVQGIIVFGGAVLYWLLDMRARRNEGAATRRFWRWDAGGLFLGMIPLGFVAYLGLNHHVSGSAWTFLRYEKEHWSQTFGFFADNVAAHVGYIARYDLIFNASTWIPSILLFFTALGFILVLLRRRAPLPPAAFAFVYTFVSYSPTWLLSGSRYMLSNTPLFLAPALLIRRRSADRVYSMISFALMLLFGLLYVQGGQLY